VCHAAADHVLYYPTANHVFHFSGAKYHCKADIIYYHSRANHLSSKAVVRYSTCDTTKLQWHTFASTKLSGWLLGTW
jgi:hypothetical protein